MVFPGDGDYMATTTRPERSKTLHNFTLPNLKWGSQRHLKCMKIDSTRSGSSGTVDHRHRRRSPPLKLAGSSVSIPFRFGEAVHQSSNHRFKSVDNGSEEGIEEFRVKIISDLKTVRDKITQSMFRKDVIEEQDEQRQTDGSGPGSCQEKEREVSPVKPWNLRKRRAACKEPISGKQYNSLNQINKGFPIEERIVNPTPSRIEWTRLKEKSGGAEVAETKLFVQLSKKDIEDDFKAMLGHRPSRRPKKRPRTVQKKLDNLFPGLYSEVTLDAYKVPEEAKNPQR